MPYNIWKCPEIARPEFRFLTRVAARPEPGGPGLIHPALAAAAGGVPVGPGGPKWEFPNYFKALASGPFRSSHRRPGWVWFVRIKGPRGGGVGSGPYSAEGGGKDQSAPGAKESAGRRFWLPKGANPYKTNEILQMVELKTGTIS